MSPEEVVLQGLSPAEVAEYRRLLRRIWDEIMLVEPGGEVYVAGVYRHTPEVVRILMRDERLRREAEALLVEARPGLEEWLAGRGVWRFSRGWVRRAEALLGAVAEKGSPSLRVELAWWRERVVKWERADAARGMGRVVEGGEGGKRKMKAQPADRADSAFGSCGSSASRWAAINPMGDKQC